MARLGDANRSNYTVSDGVIRHSPSGSTLRYGQVAADAALLTPPASAPLVPDSQFTSIGKTLPRPDIPSTRVRKHSVITYEGYARRAVE
jgi:isoquinoline 1-oxidoreductase beta subunit